MFAPNVLRRLEAGIPITALAGMHSGCFELFAHEHIRTFTDLRGKRVGLGLGRGSVEQSFVSIMAAWVGVDPKTDIQWITTDDVAEPIDLFVQGRIDAYLAYVSESQDLRARKIGHVIMDMGRDKPFANNFCCMIVGHADFVRRYPVATKRALRAILKATDLCSVEPERTARRLVEGGFAPPYDIARQIADRYSICQLARARPRGLAAVLRTLVVRVRRAHLQPQQAHCQRQRLAFSRTDQARAKGVKRPMVA